MPEYPYEDGDVIVLGPECFVSKDESVLCWKGENYVPQPEPLTPHEARAVRLALIFGAPHPTPAEVESAKAKIAKFEALPDERKLTDGG